MVESSVDDNDADSCWVTDEVRIEIESSLSCATDPPFEEEFDPDSDSGSSVDFNHFAGSFSSDEVSIRVCVCVWGGGKWFDLISQVLTRKQQNFQTPCDIEQRSVIVLHPNIHEGKCIFFVMQECLIVHVHESDKEWWADSESSENESDISTDSDISEVVRFVLWSRQIANNFFVPEHFFLQLTLFISGEVGVREVWDSQHSGTITL